MWPKQFFWMLFPKSGRNWVTFGTCLCELALLCLPIRPWGSRWWGRWSQITVRRCWRRIRCRARRCSPPLSPEATLSVSSLQEEKTASESSSDCFFGGEGNLTAAPHLQLRFKKVCRPWAVRSASSFLPGTNSSPVLVFGDRFVFVREDSGMTCFSPVQNQEAHRRHALHVSTVRQ